MKKIETNKLKLTLKACRKSFVYTALFSCFINLLMLTVPLYMLQIYDRVLTSQSYDTLLFLTLIAIFALFIMGFLDAVRSRVLQKISHWLDNHLSPFALMNGTKEMLNNGQYGYQSMQDVSQLREFLCGRTIVSLFDLPWSIIYLAVIYMLHPYLGVLATVGIVILLIFSFIGEVLTRGHLADASETQMRSSSMVQSIYANAESVQAMGMLDNLIRKWFGNSQDNLSHQEKAGNYSSTMTSAAMFVRMSLQIGVLGVGAYLVLQNTFTPGSMIAASILTSRAMAPVVSVIATWKKLLAARTAYGRLSSFLGNEQAALPASFLVEPEGKLSVSTIYYQPKGMDKPLIKGVNFDLDPGDILVVLGPSGAGKSTLMRLLGGIWLPSHGHVSLDGCDMSSTDRSELGCHLGYVPQQVKLFTGTVRDNIARMTDASDEAVVEAAELAGVHDMIQAMPNGYNTEVTPFSLSGGAQQRIALARAFFGNPCLLLLDEPNASLDEMGHQALSQAIIRARERSITAVIVTHHTMLLKVSNKVLLMREGAMQDYGSTQAVLSKLQQAAKKSSASAAVTNKSNIS